MSDKSMESEVSGEAMVVRIVEPARELEHLYSHRGEHGRGAHMGSYEILGGSSWTTKAAAVQFDQELAPGTTRPPIDKSHQRKQVVRN